MERWTVRIWCMTASYLVGPFFGTKEDAIQEARAKAMDDMKHWNYSAIKEE